MHPNAELITRFYTCFQSLDAEGMAACYHDDATFSDPVFPNLSADEARAMWRMLCARAENFSLVFRDVDADDATGRAYWEPTYDFSRTGRRVLNKVHARFDFKDGLIVKHNDDFGLWRWTRMALGPTGVFMGWMPPVQNKIRRQADAGLRAFLAQGEQSTS